MRKNERLIDCIPYKASDSNWYMRLIYGYEDEKGKHEVVFPKVKLPVSTDGAVIRGVKDAACAFDIVTDPAVHELTVEEIEKRLGYKVKIVSKATEK